jgi:predicted nucleic acid-binding protein
MIVVDTNTIAYLYLPSDFTVSVEAVLQKDSDWTAPVLWRSELRNILAFYMKQGLLGLSEAVAVQTRAELLLNGNEYEVDSLNVLQLASRSGCTAYDCEFVYLALSQGTKLVTADKKLLREFPETAIKASDFAV